MRKSSGERIQRRFRAVSSKQAVRIHRQSAKQAEFMGSCSPMHWMVVLAVVLLLFGSGRVSNLMGDVALGLKSFRKTMADDENATPGAVASVLPGPAMPADPAERL
jgi:sec-independent protein translocase protein TatA